MSNQRIPTGNFVSVSGRPLVPMAPRRVAVHRPAAGVQPGSLRRRFWHVLAAVALALAVVPAGLALLHSRGGSKTAESTPLSLELPIGPVLSPSPDSPDVAHPAPPMPTNPGPAKNSVAGAKLAPKDTQLPVVNSSWPSHLLLAATKSLAAATAPPPPAPKPQAPFKRRQLLDRADLSRQLLLVNEMDRGSLKMPWLRLPDLNGAQDPDPSDPGASTLRQVALSGLPFRMGVDCHLDREGAENLQVLSSQLRNHMGNSAAADKLDCRLNAGNLRQHLLTGKDAENPWLQDDAVPVLMQLLQPENRPVRLLLVELLTRISGPRATIALAKRAIHDLDADVRQAAVRALADRPRPDYRAILLEGLRYPWPPVADHAAETLVAVKDHDALPALRKLADEPDPAAPFRQEGETRTVHMVRELVRVNHLANCAMCHPQSASSTDLVRAAIPVRGQPLPSSPTAYYQPSSSFIHADITYLQQDFSVMQPVSNHGSWPAHQRFDYLVRTRPANLRDITREQFPEGNYPQRESVLFAIRDLTKHLQSDLFAFAR
jgi:hypothetical protein